LNHFRLPGKEIRPIAAKSESSNESFRWGTARFDPVGETVWIENGEEKI